MLEINASTRLGFLNQIYEEIGTGIINAQVESGSSSHKLTIISIQYPANLVDIKYLYRETYSIMIEDHRMLRDLLNDYLR